MDEYIDREAFLKDIEERYCLPCKEAGRDHNGCKCRACWVDDMCGEVIDAPAADVAPVVHGRWVEYQIPPIICCSNCDWATGIEEKNFQHCPNCGAKMDGGDSDEVD